VWHIAAHATAKTPLPPIPFDDLIQSSKNSLGSDCLNAWFNAKWTPVAGNMSECIAYQDKFCKRNHAAMRRMSIPWFMESLPSGREDGQR
jgi:hypothetical protein